MKKRWIVLLTAGLCTASLAQTPKPRTLTIALNAYVNTLDPHHAGASIIGARTYNLMFDSLTDFDEKDRLRPMLATRWSSKDNVTWVFQLRPKVRFHDGSTMTAEDVAYSLNRLLNDDKPSSIRSSYQPYIKSIKATGPLEVTITTTQPDVLLPRRLATQYTAIMPKAYLQKTSFEALQLKPVGTGPYRVTEYSPGGRMVLERHDAYWGGKPVAERVVVRAIAENSTRVAALLSGEVDIATNIPPDVVSQVESRSNLQVDDVALDNYMLLYFNTRSGPTANVHLRRALSLAIDREGISKALWGGRVRVMNDYFLPNELAYSKNRPNFRFDLDEARKELKLAGYKGEEILFATPATYYTNGKVVTDAIYQMWKNLGVNVKYTPLETVEWSQMAAAGKIQVTLQSFSTDGDPGTNNAVKSFAENTLLKNYYVASDTFVRLANQSLRTSNVAARIKNYRQIAGILDKDLPITPLYQSVELVGVKKNVRWTPHPRFYINLRPGKFDF
ncbi:peptide/nickel transport system substrate-binding protein [Deinobacterium chartae]|uniref:Peptide/nickel transport system substrate-binding protein n=1 Tax=Deinobacterium chartae TaxID=521158 RepID=A0A841I2U1_9DEIO|nr:ABC transporter substrate-binding protein [Deinobacterium chartae]MBB6100131.1 peptide/nickel transport system substrate-binding protein [Deinobacterium chartae]